MENYKVQIKTRKNALSLVAAATLLIYVGLVFYRGGLPELPSFIKGFHTGAFIGTELFLVLFLVKYIKASKNDEELKKLYIEENDERNGLILQSASSLSIIIILIGLAIASVIAGFFNSLIFYTLLAALLFVVIIFFMLWKYYTKKL
ncbi:hypothetical protein [Paenibacillus sp. L3-i20]|uniref:hypothetical protein n=1 Tax=Paenibacillus sp. L3-i20 TaxID=2905833 RepID=UPI001EE0B05C|nr:hypothetical protein [Paenibacillus sp. L3-i20]GKU77366.1 hypothetical protein L3i20_v217630 [Paenibacillus sp. L3-i20]